MCSDSCRLYATGAQPGSYDSLLHSNKKNYHPHGFRILEKDFFFFCMAFFFFLTIYVPKKKAGLFGEPVKVLQVQVKGVCCKKKKQPQKKQFRAE